MPLTPGLYEDVIDREKEQMISGLPDADTGRGAIAADRAADLLADWLARKVRAALETIPETERPGAQVRIVNQMLTALGGAVPALELGAEESLVEPGSLLLHVVGASKPGLGRRAPPVRPQIPLRESALLVNAPHDLHIGACVAQEMQSADRVDLLCSFVRWSGLRIIEGAIRDFAERGGVLRVITTVYMGATERRALDRLLGLGAQVRISHDADRTRLHAKA